MRPDPRTQRTARLAALLVLAATLLVPSAAAGQSVADSSALLPCCVEASKVWLAPSDFPGGRIGLVGDGVNPIAQPQRWLADYADAPTRDSKAVFADYGSIEPAVGAFERDANFYSSFAGDQVIRDLRLGDQSVAVVSPGDQTYIYVFIRRA